MYTPLRNMKLALLAVDGQEGAAFFASLASATPKVLEEFSAIIRVTISDKNGTAQQHQNLTGTGMHRLRGPPLPPSTA